MVLQGCFLDRFFYHLLKNQRLTLFLIFVILYYFLFRCKIKYFMLRHKAQLCGSAICARTKCLTTQEKSHNSQRPPDQPKPNAACPCVPVSVCRWLMRMAFDMRHRGSRVCARLGKDTKLQSWWTQSPSFHFKPASIQSLTCQDPGHEPFIDPDLFD